MSRKVEILDALIEIFNTKGLDANFSISELARKVDIGKSTIYEYFDTKDEILTQAMIRIFERAIESVSAHEPNLNLPFEQLLKEELHYVFHLATESSNIFKYIMPMQSEALPKHMKNSGIGRELRKTAQKFEAMFTSVLTKGVEEQYLHVDDIAIQGTLFAALISGSINRLSNANVEQQETVNLDQYIDALYDTILYIFK
ncbi:TetR/AcrR family transcriptional regulator [Candidatus Xianfuyuplasma coldseepsis]|uniref:TetR/AcrR family transcriptional regulator n=1 Tax=Candidatus Xianfuyuplasma coldseepsis TaxID=2782163 RepID=A0A7L7KRC0_9MOLU|nr:TetR/AcrR family transcriptional regulator [Xianfuyuplasma coldseepsis]QMS84756.1 TetR/AcrR family transcriptional regulator [Xianfuyuplasma coldseepsis]